MRILILGTFFNNRKGLPRSQAEELLKMLQEMDYKGIGVSKHMSSVMRFMDQVWNLMVCARYKKRVAIIDFFGSRTFYLQVFLVIVADLLNYRIIINLHGGSLPERYEKSRYLSKLCYRKAAIIKAPSSFLKDFIESKGFQCVLVENTIDLVKYEVPLKSKINPTILWMRTFHDAYDPYTALHAFKLLLNEFEGAHMTMAGSDQGLLVDTKQMAIKLQIDEHVSFPGFINHEQKISLAGQCDIYLCTNKIDNAPVSIIEMMAMGLSIVSTNAGGIPSIVEHKRTAMLSNPGDAQSLCDCMSYLLCNQKESLNFIRNAKHDARKYDKQVIKNKWKTLIDSM